MRYHTIITKVKTEFGSLYISIDLNDLGHPVGGNIATPEKEPESQITRLVHTLSKGLDKALRSIGDENG